MIPTANREDYFRETLLTVLQAATPVDEVLVLHQGTAYKTIPNAPNLRFFTSENHLGIPGARNFLLHHATGSYVLFVDDDDLMVAESLEWRIDELANHGHFSACGGSIRNVVDAHGCLRPDWKALTVPAKAHQTVDAQHSAGCRARSLFAVQLGRLLLRTTTAKGIGGFRTDLDCLEDFDFLFRLSATAPLQLTDRPVLDYRIHRGSHSTFFSDCNPSLPPSPSRRSLAHWHLYRQEQGWEGNLPSTCPKC